MLDRKLENRQNGAMKTTLDLPDELVREIKLRAVNEGRTLKDVIADLLRAGLAPARKSSRASDLPLPKNLPLMKVRPVQVPTEHKLSTQEWCNWLKDVDLQMDIGRHEKAPGHQHVDRADA